MSGDGGEERTVLVDASVIITLARVDALAALYRIPDDVAVPDTVRNEVTVDPAVTTLSNAIKAGAIEHVHLHYELFDAPMAASHLGKDLEQDDLMGYGHLEIEGDIALLAIAMEWDGCVVVTDDKPLRKSCKALSIPVSGSIGVLIRAVERGDLQAEVAMDKLYAMDEVGARLSASLIKRAEKMIEEASDD